MFAIVRHMIALHKLITDPDGIVRRHAPYLLIIFLLCMAIYGRTLSFDFLTNWDDPDYITQNQAIRGFSFQHIVLAFTHPYVGNIAPVQIISYMFDYLLWGMNPAGFRLTNILLHAANGMLFYTLTTKISGTKTAGLIAGILFVSHPVQVETVAWLSQRKTLLSLFFFLISFLMYIRSQQQERHSRTIFILAIGAFIASLLSKPTAVVLPLCLVAYEVTIAGNSICRDLWKRLLPFIVAAIAMGLLTIYVQAEDMGGGRIPYHGGSPWATFLTMIPVLLRYLRMLIFPFELSALYILPIKTVPDMEVLLATVLLGAIFAAIIVSYRRLRPLCFWCALFFIPLLPVSQIIPLVTLINDRYLYFPMLGAAGLAGHSAIILSERLTAGRIWLFCGFVAFATTYFSITSFLRTTVWRDSVTLWSDAVRKNPPSKDLLGLLAASYKDAGQTAEAVDSYRHIFSMDGEFVEPRYEQAALKDAAMVYMNIGSFNEAEKLLLRLTEKFPKNPSGFTTLAVCYSATGRKEAAETAYRHALKLAPDNPYALTGLASLFLDNNELDKAAPLLDRVITAGIDGPDIRVALARLAARRGNYYQALEHLEKSLLQGLVKPERLKLLPEFIALSADQRFRRITGEIR